MTPKLPNNSPEIEEIEICAYSTMRKTTSIKAARCRACASPSEADVEPLVSKTKDGVPYLRRPAVEAQLRSVLLLSHAEWMRQAKKYFPETLVHLIRQTRLGDPEIYGALAAELNRRIARIARKAARGYGRLAADEIVGMVRVRVLQLVFANSPSRKSEFLEVSFFGAVADYTRVASEDYEKTMPGERDYIFQDAVDDDGDEIERPMELLLSDYAGPEEAVIAVRNRELVQTLLDLAAHYVDDPRCLEAVVLHVMEGIKITSNDPEEDTLTRRYGATLGQVQHMLKTGLRALRRGVKELGVKDDGF